jgi:hypothetical protein
MPLKSSPGWAIGAVGLTILIACTPAPERTEGTDAAPQVEVRPESMPAPPPLPPVTPETPGYAGLWAENITACAEPDTGYTLTAERLDIPAQKRSCAVTSIREEHPSGRAMNYVVEAACTTDGVASRDTFRFEFGAADTIMQLRMGEAAPVRLERCPSVATP